MSDIVLLDAVDLSRAIHAREVSCREVMAAHLAHIDRVNPAVNAIVSRVDDDELLAQSDLRDTSLRSGPMGPLHGFPHAVKDLAATRGIRTTSGSPIFADHVPTEDAIFVERLRASGAILIGKTNVPEFGLGSHTTNPVFGVTRNAYDPARSAGGSSGGAAVALAWRMVPLADGSDFGGSLRNPAGWNNVFGFRPSSGVVPSGPSPDLFLPQMGVDGPMARSVTDLALLLSVMAGPDPRAPLSLGRTQNFAAPLQRDMTGLRIGWLGDLGGALPMEPGVLDTCLAALRMFETTGVTVEPVSLGVPEPVLWETWLTLRHWLVAGRLADIAADPVRRFMLKPAALWEIQGAQRLSAADVHRASVTRSDIYRALCASFERFDVLALPTAQMFPFAAELDWPRQVAGVAMDTYHRWMEVTYLATLAGCPVAAVPAGFGGPHDLPMGVQLIGRPQQDFALLQVANGYEQATGWAKRRLPEALEAA